MRQMAIQHPRRGCGSGQALGPTTNPALKVQAKSRPITTKIISANNSVLIPIPPAFCILSAPSTTPAPVLPVSLVISCLRSLHTSLTVMRS